MIYIYCVFMSVSVCVREGGGATACRCGAVSMSASLLNFETTLPVFTKRSMSYVPLEDPYNHAS
jgi:hypothetical protein